MSDTNTNPITGTDTPATPPATPETPADPGSTADAGIGNATGNDTGIATGGDTPDNAPKAPETYDFSKLGEGVEISEEAVTHYSPVFKEADLTQEQASKVMLAYHNDAKATQEQILKNFETQKNDWKSEAMRDAEIGGANWEESVARIKGVVQRIGSDRLAKEILNDMGLGNNVEMLRLLNKVGKMTASDKSPGDSKVAPEPVAESDMETRWYPKPA